MFGKKALMSKFNANESAERPASPILEAEKLCFGYRANSMTTFPHPPKLYESQSLNLLHTNTQGGKVALNS